MSTKESFFYSKDEDVCGYQELSFDDENNNPVCVQINRAKEFRVEKHVNSDAVQVTVEIAAPEVFDDLAIAWCKKRNLQGALGGPVGKEWGAPDCDYD